MINIIVDKLKYFGTRFIFWMVYLKKMSKKKSEKKSKIFFFVILINRLKNSI